MANTLTATSNSSNLHLYYVKTLLDVLYPRLSLYDLGKKTKLPKGLGKQVKWLRWSRIASSTTALTESVAPSDIAVTSQNVTATVAQYGQFAKVSDFFEMTAIDDVISELSENFGKAGAESIEDLIVAVLDAGLPVQYTNKRANANALTAGDVPVMKEFLRAQINLKSNYVKPHEHGAFMAVLHAATEYDLRVETNLGGWLDVSSYSGADAKNVVNGEIGKLYGTRFVTSDKMTAADNSASISIKNNYLLGSECFGVVDLGGSNPAKNKNIEMIIKPSDSGGVANPLNQYGTVGYKIMGFVAKYLGGSGNGTADRGYLIKGATSL